MTPPTLDDAIAELTDAYANGSPERIAVAEAAVDQLDVKPAPISLLSAALWYAEQGFPVFPLQPGRKGPWAACAACKGEEPGTTKCSGPEECGHPTCHGLKDATRDTAKIRWWWDQRPQANIGIATGHLTDVVDIDGPVGQASRAQHWDDIFGAIDADSVAKVLTPRPGGMHIHVPAAGDPNSTNIVPSVDYRGIGGYAIMPPSIILPGTKDHPGTYRFLGTPDFASLAEVAAS